ncbi:50S ribosomal protein L28 [Dermabacteraceae bacterium P13115]|nr:50S ribosomal protein L28 [Dermabacteraceae bacterium TAE3-ERU5]
MSAYCQVTQAKPSFGRNVSHSNRRTSRRFMPNLQRKKYYVPSLGRSVTLTVSARGIKIIDARGIDSVVNEILRRGEKL